MCHQNFSAPGKKGEGQQTVRCRGRKTDQHNGYAGRGFVFDVFTLQAR